MKHARIILIAAALTICGTMFSPPPSYAHERKKENIAVPTITTPGHDFAYVAVTPLPTFADAVYIQVKEVSVWKETSQPVQKASIPARGYAIDQRMLRCNYNYNKNGQHRNYNLHIDPGLRGC